MEHWFKNKVAVVTGASSGIGTAISKALVNEGLKVVGFARRLPEMEKMKEEWKDLNGTFYPLHCDLQKEEDIIKGFEWVTKHLGGVDIVINNAAVCVIESIIEGKTVTFRNTVEVNVIAVAICIRESVKSMRNRNVPGHVININSLTGHKVYDLNAPYSMYSCSKFALTAMGEEVRNELKRAKYTAIKVTNLSLGLVNTPITQKAIKRNYPYIESKQVADAVIYILSSPPDVLIEQLTIGPAKGFGPRTMGKQANL